MPAATTPSRVAIPPGTEYADATYRDLAVLRSGLPGRETPLTCVVRTTSTPFEATQRDTHAGGFECWVGDLVGIRRLERTARRVLDRLNDQLGTAGLVAAATAPGLAAVVDQHAAAVRDILTVGVESGAAVAGVVLLAGYAQGVLDHLRERGYTLSVPNDTASWLEASWYHVRLLAVCALARNLKSNRPLAA